MSLFWQRFLHCTVDQAANQIHSVRPKQETEEGTRGRLLFSARIQFAPRMRVWKPGRGLVWFVQVSLIQDSEGTHRNTQTLHTGSIVAPSVCLQHCSLRVLVIAAAALNRMHDGCFQAGVTALVYTSSTDAQPLPHTHIPLRSSQDQSQH